MECDSLFRSPNGFSFIFNCKCSLQLRKTAVHSELLYCLQMLYCLQRGSKAGFCDHQPGDKPLEGFLFYLGCAENRDTLVCDVSVWPILFGRHISRIFRFFFKITINFFSQLGFNFNMKWNKSYHSWINARWQFFINRQFFSKRVLIYLYLS